MDVALLQYILTQKKQGIPSEEITQMLMSRGWPLEAIDEAFKYISAHPDQVEFHEKTFSKTLRGPIDLTQAAIRLILDHIWGVIFLSFVPTALSAVFIIITIILSFAGISIPTVRNLFSSPAWIISVVIVFIGIVITIGFLYAWCQVALYELLTTRNERIGWREAMRRSVHKVIPFSWMLFLYSLIVLGGFILLIIPGIILNTWFVFAPYVYILEREKGVNALIKSREYVQGIVFAVFLRLFFIFAFLMGISVLTSFAGSVLKSDSSNKILIELLSFLINLLTLPFSIAYLYLLFENVRSIKGILPYPKKPNKMSYIVIGILGVVMSIILLSFIIGLPFLLFIKNPTKQFALSNDTKRKNDVYAILNALSQYQVDNKGALPAGIPVGTPAVISSSGVDICADLVDTYLAALPVDPLTNKGTAVTDCTAKYDTNYEIVRNANDNSITVSAPAAEVQKTISVTR